MKTVIDRRFSIGLIVGSILLGAAVHGLHAFQIHRQSSFLLEVAHRAVKEKQFELALNRFAQYTRLAPQDIDAQAEQGLLLADRNVLQPAAYVLENVLRSRPNRDDIRRRAAEVEMEIGRYRDAQEHIEKHLLVKAPGDGSLKELLGTCQAANGEYLAAVKSLRAAIELAPHQIDAYVALAEILRQRLNRPLEADQSMEALVQANPNSARARAMHGRYLHLRGDDKHALEEAEAALKLDPKNTEALLLAARLVMAKAQYDKAREYARQAIAADATLAAAYLSLAEIEQRTGDQTKAIACLESGVDKTAPKNEQLLWELGRLRIEAGELTKVQEVIDRLRKLPAHQRVEPLIEYLEARLAFANGDWLLAIQRFEQAAPLLVNNWTDLLKQIRYELAACHGHLGNTELQLAAYREATRIDPTWAPARLGTAATLYNLGRFDEALDEYRQIGKLDGMSAAGAAGEARLLILKNLAAGAAEQNWQEVNAILDRLAHDNPDSIGVTLLRAESLAGQKRAGEAEKLLLAARTKSPAQIELWTALLGLAGRQQQWDRAEQLLDEANKKFGDQIWLRLAKGSYLLARHKQDSAPKLKPLGDGTDKLSGENLVTLYRGLAVLSLEAGDTEQARGFARSGSAADPKNLEIRSLLFELALRSGDAAGIEQVLKEIRNLEGEGPLWHYGQAALCLLTKPTSAALDEAALGHLSEAHKLRPGWARVPLLTARLRDRQGQPEIALAGFLEAIALGEHGAGAVRRTIELLYLRQRYAQADTILRSLEPQPTLFSGELGRLSSEISVRLENVDRALEIATKVAAESKDWRDHVWLGQLQTLVGRRAQANRRLDEAKNRLAEAEKSLRLAVQLKPDVADTWVALIRFYAATDRKPEAETTIQQAQSKLPHETEALTLAACFEAIGDVDRAAKQYQSALATTAHDATVVRRVAEFSMRAGKLDEAEAQLRTIVSGQVAAKPEEVVSARLELVSVLRASGSYPKVQQALALVEQNLSAVNSLPEDQRAKALQENRREQAFALAVCPQPMRRRAAIKILEKLLTSQPDAADLQMTLAQLYVAEQDWLQASKRLRDLVSSHDRDPRYIAFYVAQLLDHQEAAEAELWLRRLEQLAPQEFTTISLQAQTLAHRGQVDQAIQTLRDYLAQPAAEATAPKAVATAISQLMGSAAGDAGRVDLLEKLLLSALDKHHRPTPLLLCLADLRVHQERMDDAAELYHEILKAEENNVVAMNNLAMLLALEKTHLDESLRLVERAISLTGPRPALLDSRASVYLALGKPQQALADLEQAVSEEPRANRQFHRALAYSQLGQEQAAAQALGEARKLGLKPDELNPLERPGYRALAAKLER